MTLPRVDPRVAGMLLMAHSAWIALFVVGVTFISTVPGVVVLGALALFGGEEDALPGLVAAIVIPVVILVPFVTWTACGVVAGWLFREGHPWGRPLAAAMAALSVFAQPLGLFVTAAVFLALREDTPTPAHS